MSSLFIFLMVIHLLIAAALVGTILVQKSEGGGLGIGGGGSPGGLMSARGAASFLTRATAILATMFVIVSIILAGVAVNSTGEREIDSTLDRSVTAPEEVDPLAALGSTAAPAEATDEAAADAAPASDDPLAGSAE
jgi:preprotein translocase subunit SecG